MISLRAGFRTEIGSPYSRRDYAHDLVPGDLHPGNTIFHSDQVRLRDISDVELLW